MPAVKRVALVLALALFGVAARGLPAQSLSELFQSAKSQVKAGAWQEALKTLDAVDAEAGKPGNAGAPQELEAPVAFYRAVCEANLDQPDKAKADFQTFLRTQPPNASLNTSMYSKKAVAAFAEAKKTLGEGPQNTEEPIEKAYRKFRPPAGTVEAADEHWADGPAQWLLNAEEKTRWSTLKDAAARQDFVAQFWKSRDTSPETSDNEFLAEFERRVMFADATFKQDERRGSLTERGMVFIALGPPTRTSRKTIGSLESRTSGADLFTRVGDESPVATSAIGGGGGGSPTSRTEAPIAQGEQSPGAAVTAQNWREVWRYDGELLPRGLSYRQIDVEFVSKKGYGINVLQREPQVVASLEAARRGRT